MNICILSHRYPYKDNMVHVFVKKLVDEWAKMGHHCVVISPLSVSHLVRGVEKKTPKYERQKVVDGVFVNVYRPVFIDIPKLKVGDVSVSSNLKQRCIEKSIKMTGIKFDAIYCHFFQMGLLGWHYAYSNNIPLIVATGESSFIKYSKPCKSFTFEKFKETLTGVVAVSSKNKNEATELNLAPVDKIKVFPNGTCLKLFHKLDKNECRKKLDIPTDQFIITCVGQFVERKGQKRILQALDILNKNDISVIFIGKGKDVLEHDSILYKGTIKNTDLPLYLNASDIFVLPTRHEGCCNAIIEALACGLPIISSDRPFNYDVLNSENSILVDPDNIEQIANAIGTLYCDKQKMKSMAESSYATGQSLSIEKRAESILEFMVRQICNSN